MFNIIYTIPVTDDELLKILELQKQNLLQNVDDDTKQKEGFVTVEHDLALLKEMNLKLRHIIAKDGAEIVGYALSMHKDFANKIDVLKPMFQQIKAMQPPVNDYMVMGQICVAESHRGKGIFKGLYNKMKTYYANQFNSIITEIDTSNTRSIKAHQSVGFKNLKEFSSGGQDWAIVSLDV